MNLTALIRALGLVAVLSSLLAVVGCDTGAENEMEEAGQETEEVFEEGAQETEEAFEEGAEEVEQAVE